MHEGQGIVVWIVIGAAAVCAAIVVLLYNRLVHARARVEYAWAQVAAQLQRRHDLIPNLVAIVGAYAGHEQAALQEVTAARTAALTLRDGAARAGAEDQLTAALRSLIAVSEGYPDLRADERFAHLQRELTETEDRVAFARGFANDRVRRYHELTGTFPSNVIARTLGFRPAASFGVQDALTKIAPAVEFDR